MTNPKLGVDLGTGATPQGDIGLIADLGNVRSALFCRLCTPLGSLFAHPDYGNPMHDILSEPMDDTWKGQAISAIQQCLDQEPRITAENIGVEFDPEARKVLFSISYRVLDVPGENNLVWEVELS